MKRKMLFFILIFLLTTHGAYAFGDTEAEPADIVIELNNNIMDLEAPPYIMEGRTLVPLRYIFEPLGLEVMWDQATRTAIGKKEGLLIELPIGHTTAVVNGESVLLEVPAVIINDRTYVPLRFVAETTGALVKWNGETRTASISSSAPIEKIDYSSHSVDELLISIYQASQNKSQDRSEVIREQYLEIVRKISLISNRNKSNTLVFRSAIRDLSASMGLILDESLTLDEMLFKFDEQKRKHTALKIEENKKKYELYEYASGDRYYGPSSNGSLDGFGLYEFNNGNILLGDLKNAKRHGYVTNVYDNGYAYSHFREDEEESFEFSYTTFDKSILISIIHFEEGLREGSGYAIRMDLDKNKLYDRFTDYKAGSETGFSEILFIDGTRRFDRANQSINDMVVKIEPSGDYFILPTDASGKSIEERSGFAYKKFADGVEYIGEFFKESRLGDAMYYAPDDQSDLESNLMDQRAIEIIESIITEEQTEEEKIKVIHDYLAAHVLYDPAEDENFPNVSHTAYGALVNGVAVCDGYSEAFKYLLKKVDIESVIVFGEAYDDGTDFTEIENHAWNLVKVGSVYYHYDLTWADDDLNNLVHYDYYKKESNFFDETHWWQSTNYKEFLKE